MTEFLSIFLTWQFLVLCVGIAAITFVIRTIIEYFILNNPRMPGNSQSRFWRDLALVILPIGLGILFAVFGKSFPYPEAISEPYSKFLFSSSAGLLSPTLYRVIKALFWKPTGIDYNPIPYPVYNPQINPVYPVNPTPNPFPINPFPNNSNGPVLNNNFSSPPSPQPPVHPLSKTADDPSTDPIEPKI